MRRYKYAISLLVLMNLISGCRSHSTQGRWSAPVRAAYSCVSHITGRSHEDENPTAKSPPEESLVAPSTQPISDSESVDQPPESLESAPLPEQAGELPEEVSVDQPLPVAADGDGGETVDSEAWSLDHSVLPADSVEALRSLGGLLKFSDEGELLVANLAETPVTDHHVELLTQIESLRAVDLSGTQVTNACLKKLGGALKLEMLAICDTEIDDEGIRDIVDLKHLRFISIERTEITDDGLRYLRALIHLEGVSLRGTAVTHEAVRDFQRAHPDCRILSDHDEENSSFNIRPNDHFSRDSSALYTITDTGSWPRTQLRRVTSSQTVGANSIPASIPASSDDPERVVQQLQQIISERLSDRVVLAAAGKVYLTQERWDDAVSVLSAALEQDLHDDRVRFDLAVALGHSGDIDKSLLRFTEVIGSAAAHYNIGVLLYESGDVPMSRYFFRQARQHDSRYEIPEDVLPQLSRQESPGINIRADAMPAVSSNELLRLLAGPAQQSRHDENWSINIVPSRSPDAAPSCLTTMQGDGTVPGEPTPLTIDMDINGVSPIGWTTAPSWDD